MEHVDPTTDPELNGSLIPGHEVGQTPDPSNQVTIRIALLKKIARHVVHSAPIQPSLGLSFLFLSAWSVQIIPEHGGLRRRVNGASDKFRHVCHIINLERCAGRDIRSKRCPDGVGMQIVLEFPFRG